jgi:hypothetical protein
VRGGRDGDRGGRPRNNACLCRRSRVGHGVEAGVGGRAREQAGAVLRGQRRRAVAVAVVVHRDYGAEAVVLHRAVAALDVQFASRAAPRGAAGEGLEERRRPQRRRVVVPQQLGQLLARPAPARPRNEISRAARNTDGTSEPEIPQRMKNPHANG